MPTGRLVHHRHECWDKNERSIHEEMPIGIDALRPRTRPKTTPSDFRGGKRQNAQRSLTQTTVVDESLRKRIQASRKARFHWSIIRKAVNGTRFCKRAQAQVEATAKGVDLGSMKQFINKATFVGDFLWTEEEQAYEQRRHDAEVIIKTELDREQNIAERTMFAEPRVPSTPRPQTVPSVRLGGTRRKVNQVGKMLSDIRFQSPRNRQLRNMMPGFNEDAWESAWARELGLDLAQKRAKRFIVSTSRPVTAPQASLSLSQGSSGGPAYMLSAAEQKAAAEARLEQSAAAGGALFARALRDDRSFFKHYRHSDSAFNDVSVTGLSKPRAEAHPLLTAIDGMQNEEVTETAKMVEGGVLSHRLDELRWGELRRGAWTLRPERRRLQDTDPGNAKQQDRQKGGAVEAPGRQLLALSIAKSSAKAGIKDIHGSSEEMQRLVQLVDPERTGRVAAEVFVPLFFWLGLTRRRSAALQTLELAFGPGDIEISSIQKLSRYAEVQIRLIEGLRQLARRESLEQLCEYITDMTRLRNWFQTMKRDTTGHVDIVEVQNLFARMEVTSDRQTLFRFLTHIVHNDTLPSAAGERGDKDGGTLIKKTFGISDFVSLLCRCAIAWLLHRTLILLSPGDTAPKDEDSPMLMPSNSLDREAEMRWVALQRKIIISLLVNHRFWGRESRNVLTSLTQPQMTTLGTMLSPEQWLSLFQRVRAQGIASTLPVGDEATDPQWLWRMVNAGSQSKPTEE